MFALWPMEFYGDVLGQNHKILLKNRQIFENMYSHFIFTSTCILNPSEYSYDKCHRLSFLMSQTWFVYSIGHFGEKHIFFFSKISETIACKY
jgi:hypothetical protein